MRADAWQLRELFEIVAEDMSTEHPPSPGGTVGPPSNWANLCYEMQNSKVRPDAFSPSSNSKWLRVTPRAFAFCLQGKKDKALYGQFEKIAKAVVNQEWTMKREREWRKPGDSCHRR